MSIRSADKVTSLSNVLEDKLGAEMHWRRLDLNLLVVFDAVMQERSVTRAAAKLNMTQPAISNALTRLRRALRDELFVRSPTGMQPTPYAEQVAEPVRVALRGLYVALDRAAAFDPATTDRDFIIAVDNRAALVVAGPLERAVAAEAPNVRLTIRPSGTLDLTGCLDRSEIDVALGGLSVAGERFSDACLLEDGFMALVRRAHPAARDGALTMESLVAHPHLVLSSTGEDTSFVDTELARHGLFRKIAVRGPLLAAASALCQSDMIAVMGESGAQEFARIAPLEVLRLPFASPRLAMSMLWHRRSDDVPAHRWLRSVVLRISRRP